jgi:hypothetical protein
VQRVEALHPLDILGRHERLAQGMQTQIDERIP